MKGIVGEQYRNSWGCSKPTQSPYYINSKLQRVAFPDGEAYPLKMCPNVTMAKLPWLGRIFGSLGNWMEKGILPFPGSFEDQPNVIAVGLMIAENEAKRCNKEDMKPKKNKGRGGRKNGY